MYVVNFGGEVLSVSEVLIGSVLTIETPSHAFFILVGKSSRLLSETDPDTMYDLLLTCELSSCMTLF